MPWTGGRRPLHTLKRHRSCETAPAEKPVQPDGWAHGAQSWARRPLYNMHTGCDALLALAHGAPPKNWLGGKPTTAAAGTAPGSARKP